MTNVEDDKLIDFRDLIAAPLIATIEADFTASQRFVEFMLEYGMEQVSDEHTPNIAIDPQTGKPFGRLKMVTFWYTQANPKTGEDDYFRVQVPLLSLIPLPLLQIEQADFDFNIRLFSEIEYKSDAAGQKGALENGVKSVEEKAKNSELGELKGFKARLSPSAGRSEDSKTFSSLDSNMKVTVQMKQADLPVGLAGLMTVFNTTTFVTQHNRLKSAQSETTSPGDSP